MDENAVPDKRARFPLPTTRFKAAAVKIAFVFIAEAYQVHHAAAVLFALRDCPGVEVDVFHSDPVTPPQLDRLAAAHGVRPVASRLLGPGVSGSAIQMVRILGLAKPQVLARNEAMLRGYDAVISTEDGIARLFRGEPEAARPRRILITHGPAGRAVPSYPNRMECDLVLVKGPADLEVYRRLGFLRQGHIAAVGSPKSFSASLLRASAAPLFANSNPTVLYNPHKERKLRSWDAFFEPMMRAFSANRSMNLVVAPHVKLFRRRSKLVRSRLRARSDATILVDPGSDRSLDNSYTEAADIYVGDVSSQVMEFAARPRPCVFLNPHRIDWRGDPHFAAWTMGEVIEQSEALMPAIRRAPALHEEFRGIQLAMARDSLGDTGPDAVTRSVAKILEYMANGQVEP